MSDARPGRKLDRTVHKIVYGGYAGPRVPKTVLRYSTDIAAAWPVMEVMFQEHGGWFGAHGDKWECRFGDKEELAAVAPTAPLAICLAVLNLESWFQSLPCPDCGAVGCPCPVCEADAT